MKILKKTAAVIMLLIMLISTTAINASAAVTDEQRKEITDELFESAWYGGLDVTYWQCTRSTVPIKDNPLAAITYMTIEARVSVCDSELLEKFYNNDISIKDFYADYDYDYKKAKKLDKYKNSLLVGDEFTYSDYQNGVWEMELQENYERFNGYFREDAENFTLYDNDTNEVLGVYPRLLDLDYLDDDDNAENGGSGGGSGGNSGGSGYGNNSSDKTSSGNGSQNESSTVGSSSGNDRETSSVKPDVNNQDNNDTISRYDTDNPAVTPEIASAVDAMKSLPESFPADEPYTPSSYQEDKTSSSSNNSPIIIITVVVIIICGVVFFLLKKQKKDKPKE